MSDRQNLFPYEIRGAWQEAIENLDLPPMEAGAISAVIEYAQPPLSFDSLSLGTRVFCHDNEKTIDSNIISKFNSSDYISHEKPSRFATSHPVFFALTLPAKLGNFSCPVTQQARKKFSSTFQDAESGEMVSRSQFYQHTIAVRDILATLIKSGCYPDYNTVQDANIELISAISSDRLYGHIDDNFTRKIEIFKLIIDGALTPGGVQRKHKGGGGGGFSNFNTTKRDEWHEKRIKTLAELMKDPSKIRKKSIGVSTKNNDIEDTEFKNTGLQPLQKSNAGNATNDEEGDALYLQRKTPSSLTPSDDRQLTRSWLAGAPTSSIKSSTDVSRLTPDHINEVMKQPLTTICRIFSSLLISTGMPPLRLTRLTVNSEDTLETVINNGDKRPYWLPHLELICYQLLDGPVHSESSPAASWVILYLPESIRSAFNRAEFKIKKRPFLGARTDLNQQLKKYSKLISGITPTSNRISASSWLYCRPHAVDDIAAATLSGEFGLGLSAPAAYRQIPRQEHQSIFENVLRELGWKIFDAENFSQKPANTEIIEITAGSTVARTADVFSDVFKKLRSAMQSPSVSLSGWWAGESIPLAAVTELHQLVSAHEMLAWHLSTGSRPIGRDSKNTLVHKLQWIYDKNSAIGRESRAIPLLTTIRNNLESYQEWTSAIITRLEKSGVHIDDQRTGQRQTPGWMELSKRGKMIKLRDMIWRDMTSFSIIDEEDWSSNVCRHSIASWLRQHVSDAQVDHLLGHTRHGRMLASPRAETPLGQQNNLRKSLTGWLNECGYRPLDWRKMPWN